MRRITRKAWFGPKRYFGWGWTITSWEGLAVVLVYAGLLVANFKVLGYSGISSLGVMVLTLLLVLVAFITGDPPGGPRR